MELKIKNNYKKTKNIKSRLLYEKNHLDSPFLSICVPTYNRSEETCRAIKSAIFQKETLYDYNVIIVDNNSNENTDKVLDYIKEIQTNVNIKYYRNEQNIGMFGNWNRCIELSDSNWIGLLHSDDTVDDDYVERICKVIEKHQDSNGKPIGMIRVATRLLENGEDKSSHRGKVSKRIYSMFSGKLKTYSKKDALIIGNTGFLGDQTCGTILNKEAFVKIGGFNDELYPSADALNPYLLFDEYKLCCTVDKYGTEYYGENLSTSEEVHVGWAKQYVEFQDYMSGECKINRLFLDLFRDEQYYMFVNEYIGGLCSIAGKPFDRDIFYKIFYPKDRVLRRSILKIIQRNHFYFTLLKTLVRG